MSVFVTSVMNLYFLQHGFLSSAKEPTDIWERPCRFDVL